MKALITVIDDNGRIFCKDNLLYPVTEEVIKLTPDGPPVNKAYFKFTITQLMDYQIDDFEKLGGKQNDTSVED